MLSTKVFSACGQLIQLHSSNKNNWQRKQLADGKIVAQLGAGHKQLQQQQSTAAAWLTNWLTVGLTECRTRSRPRKSVVKQADKWPTHTQTHTDKARHAAEKYAAIMRDISAGDMQQLVAPVRPHTGTHTHTLRLAHALFLFIFMRLRKFPSHTHNLCLAATTKAIYVRSLVMKLKKLQQVHHTNTLAHTHTHPHTDILHYIHVVPSWYISAPKLITLQRGLLSLLMQLLPATELSGVAI